MYFADDLADDIENRLRYAKYDRRTITDDATRRAHEHGTLQAIMESTLRELREIAASQTRHDRAIPLNVPQPVRVGDVVFAGHLFEVRAYQLDSGDGVPACVQTIPHDRLPLTVRLSAKDLGCVWGTRFRVDTVAIDVRDRTEYVVSSVESVATD